MRRISLTLLLGVATLAAVTACGPAAVSSGSTNLVASAESEALAAMGVSPSDLVAAEPQLDAASDGSGSTANPSGTDGTGTGTDATNPGNRKDRLAARLAGWRKRHALRVALRNTLHGEAVVQTKNGTVTVLVQRGEVTALDGNTITVRSSDGYEETWTLGNNLRVVEKRATITADQLKVGDRVAVAGRKDGDTPTARLVIIPLR